MWGSKAPGHPGCDQSTNLFSWPWEERGDSEGLEWSLGALSRGRDQPPPPRKELLRSSWSSESFALSVLTCATFTLKSEGLEFPPLCPQVHQAPPSQMETSGQLTLRLVEHARCPLWACPRLVLNVCSWPHVLATYFSLGRPASLASAPMSLPWPVRQPGEVRWAAAGGRTGQLAKHPA